jgi:hypothetical protein
MARYHNVDGTCAESKCSDHEYAGCIVLSINDSANEPKNYAKEHILNCCMTAKLTDPFSNPLMPQ